MVGLLLQQMASAVLSLNILFWYAIGFIFNCFFAKSNPKPINVNTLRCIKHTFIRLHNTLLDNRGHWQKVQVGSHVETRSFSAHILLLLLE